MNNWNAFSASFVFLLGVSGCRMVGPEYEVPPVELGADFAAPWGEGLQAAFEGEDAVGWHSFADEGLDLFLRAAVEQNPDIEVALQRLEEARALRGIASVNLQPQVDLSLERSRNSASDSTFSSSGPAVQSGVTESNSLGLDVSWEIDLFGGLRRNIQAAEADLEALEADYADVVLLLQSEVASAYIEYRGLQERLDVARENLELQAETLELVTLQRGAGLSTERDEAQARFSLETTRARIPELAGNLARTRHRLALLAGSTPATLPEPLADALDGNELVPLPLEEISIALPAELLRRRPDIRRAERELAAQTARVGVAEAALYPSLRLGGFLGYAAPEMSDFFSSDSETWNFVQGNSVPLFNRERLHDQVRVEEARRGTSTARYRAAVLRAVSEVEDGLQSFAQERERWRTLDAGAQAAALAAELAEEQYFAGLVDFQVVLDSQQSLANAQDQRAASGALVSTRLVQLFKALGGGWASAGTAQG